MTHKDIISLTFLSINNNEKMIKKLPMIDKLLLTKNIYNKMFYNDVKRDME